MGYRLRISGYERRDKVVFRGFGFRDCRVWELKNAKASKV